ncbi:unnamed protein product [Heligmosomoides polygyrus]|uniref:Secreted protein n=1 Tax=Heligmosomoides polygyrus TaxID=6339 RepID=A0A183GUS8_HELPZ|nr:unnamed protein product [Heligmosomoides polygyrus]
MMVIALILIEELCGAPLLLLNLWPCIRGLPRRQQCMNWLYGRIRSECQGRFLDDDKIGPIIGLRLQLTYAQPVNHGLLAVIRREPQTLKMQP